MATILIIHDQSIPFGLDDNLREQFPAAEVYQVLHARATEFLLRHPDIDLIICDPVGDNPHHAFDQFHAIQALSPNARVLLHCTCIHTAFDLLSCLSTGARGFLHKTASLPEYINAISTVMEGRTYLADDVKADLIKTLRTGKN